MECKLGKGEEFIFKGEVTSVEPAYEVSGITSITIRAMDHMRRWGAAVELGSGRPVWILKWSKRWVQSVVSSVEASGTNQIRGYILQRNESNVAFLKRLTARNNCPPSRERCAHLQEAPPSRHDPRVDRGESPRSVRFAFNSVDKCRGGGSRDGDPAEDGG